jgi:hypothetical protein
MAIKNWTTTYSGATPVQDPDPVTGNQPDLNDDPGGDLAQSDTVESLRNKAHAVAKYVGDNTNLPAGCLRDVLDMQAGGDAGQVRILKRATKPTNAADKGFLYTKDVGAGVIELFYEDEAGNEDQLTPLAAVDKRVAVTSADTTPSDLDTKIVVANGIQKSVLNPAGDEDLQLSPVYGAAANTVCEGDDSRLSDARTPTSHASTHQNGGGDEVATATPGANAIPKADGSNKLVIGWHPTAAPGATGVATASGEGVATTLARSDHTHQSNTAPADTTKAAAAIGTSGEPARADHKHDISTAAPAAAGLGTTSGEGSATSLARSDHTHQSNTAPADITKAAAAVGTSTEPARADHKHDVTTAAPGATGVATASGEGSATTLARSDHTHQSNTAPADVTKAAAVIGTSGEPARADHKHDTSTAIAGAATPGDSAAEGSATSLARSDHQHGLPAFGSGSGTFCEGNDSRLSDARTPTAHDLAGAEHNADVLADLNGKVTDYSIGSPVNAEAATPVNLTANDSGKLYTNEGATAEIVFNLPTAAADLEYTFVVQDADGIQINADTGDTIRIAASVSASAGLIETTTIGNTVKLKAINATEWVALFYVGTWTVT